MSGRRATQRLCSNHRQCSHAPHSARARRRSRRRPLPRSPARGHTRPRRLANLFRAKSPAFGEAADDVDTVEFNTALIIWCTCFF